MRSHHIAVGLLLLLVAGALGVNGLHERTAKPQAASAVSSANSPSARETRIHQQLASGQLPNHPAHLHRVEPIPPADARDLSQARQTEASARRRLEELTQLLDLSASQQDRVFPLLVRSSPHYDESLRLAGREQHPGAPLTRLAVRPLARCTRGVEQFLHGVVHALSLGAAARITQHHHPFGLWSSSARTVPPQPLGERTIDMLAYDFPILGSNTTVVVRLAPQ